MDHEDLSEEFDSNNREENKIDKSYPTWIARAMAKIMGLVAKASLSGSGFSNTQIADIIQQEYNNKEKQDASSQLG